MEDIEAQKRIQIEDTWRGRRPTRADEAAQQRGGSRSISRGRISIASSMTGRRVVDPETVLPALYRTVSIGVDETIAKRNEKVKETVKLSQASDTFADLEWHTLPAEHVIQQLNTSLSSGLDSQQVQDNQKTYGFNVHTPPPNRLLKKLFLYCFGGFGSLLLAGGILCCIAWKPLGNPDPQAANLALGVVLFLVFFIQAGFNAWQDWSSSRVMNSISSMVPEDSLVVREGQMVSISTRELVPGDIVVIKTGAKVAADIRLLETSTDLKFDRAVLTGEAKPLAGVSKEAELGSNYLEVACIAMQGSYCVSGTGKGVVVSTGDHTVFGSIAKLSSAPRKGLTPMQWEIMRFVMIVISFVVVLIILVVVVWAAWIRHTYPDWIPVRALIVDCVSVAVAFIPEGLPIALTTCLTISANVMRKNNILCKSLSVIETLGSVSILCSDKTGTLTKNKMHVTNFSIGSRSFVVGEDEEKVGNSNMEQIQQVAGLCNAAEFATRPHTDEIYGDATDQALIRFADRISNTDRLRENWAQVYELAFNSKNKFMVRIMEQNGVFSLFIKGAPDILLPRCTRTLDADGNVVDMSESERQAVVDLQRKWSLEGRRVILLARKPINKNEYGDPTTNAFALQVIEEIRTGLVLVGMTGIADPPKDDIPEVVDTLRGAGIRMAMVTGDFELTAVAIARQCGIVTFRQEDVHSAKNLDREFEIRPNKTRKPFTDFIEGAIVLSGQQLITLNDNQWEHLSQYREIVFARTTPEQKLRIVKEFQARKNVVGMTGDGVNDAPSLKAADVGIAMGNGSDVAIEASDLVLLESFSSMVQALKYGRLVFDNLKKTIIYLLPAGTYSELWPVLLNVMAGLPQALSSFLMIVICCLTDCAGAITLAYEAPERDLLKRPPRVMTGERLVNFRLLFHAYLLVGTYECFTSMAMAFWYFQRRGIPFSELTLSFGNFPTLDASYVTEISNRASSIYFVNLVVIQFFNLMTTRTRFLSIFQHPPVFKKETRNLLLFVAIGFALCVVFFFLYIPWFQNVLGTTSVPVEYFFLPVGYGLFLIFMDECRKYSCRRWPNSFIAKMSW